MTVHERERDRKADRGRDIALFRYALIRAAADPALSTRQRGALVRSLAATEHRGPFGRPVRYSRESLDRWIRAWQAGGFEALLPAGRGEPKTSTTGCRREYPALTKARLVAPRRTTARPVANLTARWQR